MSGWRAEPGEGWVGWRGVVGPRDCGQDALVLPPGQPRVKTRGRMEDSEGEGE